MNFLLKDLVYESDLKEGNFEKNINVVNSIKAFCCCPNVAEGLKGISGVFCKVWGDGLGHKSWCLERIAIHRTPPHLQTLLTPRKTSHAANSRMERLFMDIFSLLTPAATKQTQIKHSSVVLFIYYPDKICKFHRWMSLTTRPLLAVLFFFIFVSFS